MLQADALEALPPSRAFLFDAYFRDRRVESCRCAGAVEPSRIFNPLRLSAPIRRVAASLALAKIDIKCFSSNKAVMRLFQTRKSGKDQNWGRP
jgi:hypothetical protein